MSVETDDTTPETDNEILELTDPVEPEEAPEIDDSDASEDEEEEILTFGDQPEEVEETDNATIRHLRSKLRETQKELAESRRSTPHEQPVEVGEKPTIAGCDYDEEAYEAELDAWKERKAAAERQSAGQSEAQEAERKAWETELTRVKEEQTALGKSDSEDAFQTVRDALSTAQQAALIQATDKGNTAKLIYALAKNPERLEALAGEANLVRFIKEVTKLEGQMKMVKRRKAPDPDVPQKGSAPMSSAAGGSAKKLAALKAEAEESGDYSKYFALKRKLGA